MLQSETYLILGLGKTGLSIARYLYSQRIFFRAIDTRLQPPELQNFQQQFPYIEYHLGGLNPQWIKDATRIVISPGLDYHALELTKLNPKVILCSDIDLFVNAAKAPIIGITGTNGKSTVTALISHLLNSNGKRVQTGGNFGCPALELLREAVPDFYVLELSSFQLELSHSLRLEVGLFLNLSVDHLDRHRTLSAYTAVKQKIYPKSKFAVWNREDTATAPMHPVPCQISFGYSTPTYQNDFGLILENNQTWLAYQSTRLINTKQLQIEGQHNWLNALSALAACFAVGLEPKIYAQSLVTFRGLTHRLEPILKHQGVTWINDSKATNIGAMKVAINSLAYQKEQLILIAGGISKEDDFSVLKRLLLGSAKAIILMGQDASKIKEALEGVAPITIVNSLQEAVQLASSYAQVNDTILFSPGCSSFDMFKNYAARGETFKKTVHDLLFKIKNHD